MPEIFSVPTALTPVIVHVAVRVSGIYTSNQNDTPNIGVLIFRNSVQLFMFNLETHSFYRKRKHTQFTTKLMLRDWGVAFWCAQFSIAQRDAHTSNSVLFAHICHLYTITEGFELGNGQLNTKNPYLWTELVGTFFIVSLGVLENGGRNKMLHRTNLMNFVSQATKICWQITISLDVFVTSH